MRSLDDGNDQLKGGHGYGSSKSARPLSGLLPAGDARAR